MDWENKNVHLYFSNINYLHLLVKNLFDLRIVQEFQESIAEKLI